MIDGLSRQMQHHVNPQADDQSQETVQAAGFASAFLKPPDLGVIVPTRNEKDNIEPLLARLDEALAGIAWEAVFVDDDSQDGTADLLLRLQSARPRVRVIRRVGRRGLSSACIEVYFARPA